jgi:hypothetical protein
MTSPAHFSTLKVALADWVERDIAAYYLACSLGLMGPEDGSLEGFREVKHVFCSDNHLGLALDNFMLALVTSGVLEHDDVGSNDRFKWNPSLKGGWAV